MILPKFLNQHRYGIGLICISLLAFILRVFEAGDSSFSNDELSALIRLRFDTLKDLIEHGIRIDGHPAGTQIFLFYWTKLVGVGEWAVRLPFILMGTLSIPLFYSFAENVSSKRIALRIAILATLSILFILNSRLARPYSMGLFFIALQYFALGRLSKAESPWYYWILFSAASALAAYSHHFAAFTALVTALAAPMLLPRQRLKGWIIACTGSIVAYAPNLGITISQLKLGGVGGWLGKADPSIVTEHFMLLINNSTFLAIFISVLILMRLFAQRLRRDEVILAAFLLIVFVLPLATGYLYSTLVNPVLQHSVLIFSAPALLMLLALLLDWGGRIAWLVNPLLLVLMLISLKNQEIYRTPIYEDFKGAAEKAELWNKPDKLPGGVCNILNINHKDYLEFYQDSKSPIDFRLLDLGDQHALARLDSMLGVTDKAYLAFYDLKPVRPEAYDLILDYYPSVNEKFETRRSRVTLFAKDGMSFSKSLADDSGCPGPALSMDSEFSINETMKLDSSPDEMLCRVSVEFKTSQWIPHELVAVSEDESGRMVAWHGMKLETFRHDTLWNRAYLRLKVNRKMAGQIKIYIWNPDSSFDSPLHYRCLIGELFDWPSEGPAPILGPIHRK